MLNNVDPKLKYHHIWKREPNKESEDELSEVDLKNHLESKLTALETHVPLRR